MEDISVHTDEQVLMGALRPHCPQGDAECHQNLTGAAGGRMKLSPMSLEEAGPGTYRS